MLPFLPYLLDHSPEGVKRAALIQLFNATGAAFECDLPRLRGLSHAACLREYARFTAEHSASALRRPEQLAAVQHRLFRNAYGLGRLAGLASGVRGLDDAMALARFLYGILDIDFVGDGCAEITIRRCYFSQFYSPQVCELMSAMDHGLLAGLANGGELVFTARITEGAPCCRARFERSR